MQSIAKTLKHKRMPVSEGGSDQLTLLSFRVLSVPSHFPRLMQPKQATANEPWVIPWA